MGAEALRAAAEKAYARCKADYDPPWVGLTDKERQAWMVEHAVVVTDWLDALLGALPEEAVKVAAGPIVGEFEEIWADRVATDPNTPRRFEPLEEICENAASESLRATLRSLRDGLGADA